MKARRYFTKCEYEITKVYEELKPFVDTGAYTNLPLSFYQKAYIILESFSEAFKRINGNGEVVVMSSNPAIAG